MLNLKELIQLMLQSATKLCVF